jgi:hypothetical protein
MWVRIFFGEYVICKVVYTGKWRTSIYDFVISVIENKFSSQNNKWVSLACHVTALNSYAGPSFPEKGNIIHEDILHKKPSILFRGVSWNQHNKRKQYLLQAQKLKNVRAVAKMEKKLIIIFWTLIFSMH